MIASRLHGALLVTLLTASCMMLATNQPSGGGIFLGNVLLDVRPLNNNVINLEAGPGWTEDKAVFDLAAGELRSEVRLYDASFDAERCIKLAGDQHYRFEVKPIEGERARLQAFQRNEDGEWKPTGKSLELPMTPRQNDHGWDKGRYLEAAKAQVHDGELTYSSLAVGLKKKLVHVNFGTPTTN